MKKEIINCLTWFANKVSETTTYGSWSDEFCRREVKEATDKFIEEIKKHIDWDNLTAEECKELRFQKWDDMGDTDLWLIPLYLMPIIPVGTELTSIFGEKIKYDGKNLDNDTRFGCIAYGIEIKRKSKQ